MKSYLTRTLILSCSLFFAYSCELGFQEEDQQSRGQSRLIVRLTDAPGDFQEVNIDLVGLRIHSLEEGWLELENFQVGNYDLLELQNGVEAILVDESFPSGSITEIRLLLGDENNVKVDDEFFPLRTPSAQTSGIKIKVHAVIESELEYSVLLDFDAERSVLPLGQSEQYLLRPVITAIMPDGTEFLNDDEDEGEEHEDEGEEHEDEGEEHEDEGEEHEDEGEEHEDEGEEHEDEGEEHEDEGEEHEGEDDEDEGEEDEGEDEAEDEDDDGNKPDDPEENDHGQGHKDKKGDTKGPDHGGDHKAITVPE